MLRAARGLPEFRNIQNSVTEHHLKWPFFSWLLYGLPSGEERISIIVIVTVAALVMFKLQKKEGNSVSTQDL